MLILSDHYSGDLVTNFDLLMALEDLAVVLQEWVFLSEDKSSFLGVDIKNSDLDGLTNLLEFIWNDFSSLF